MKKKKILVLFPVLGLLLSGCTFQEGLANAKSWVSQHIYHPIKDWISGGGNKEEPSDGGGDTEVTISSIGIASYKEEVAMNYEYKTSDVKIRVYYSDGNDEEKAPESVACDTSKAGDTTLTVTYKGFTKTATVKVLSESDVVHVEEIRWDVSKRTLHVGESVTITVTVSPENATDKSVVFKSDKPEILTVSDAGVVEAKAVGSATVTITPNDNASLAKQVSFTVAEQAASLPEATKNGYNRLAASETLKNGEKINVAGAIGEKYYVMPAYSSGNNIPAKVVELQEGKLAIDEADEFTVIANDDGSISLLQADGKYLSACGDAEGKNYLKVVSSIDDTAKFSVSVDADGNAQLQAKKVERGYLCLNPNTQYGDPLFGCYRSPDNFEKYAIYHDGKGSSEHVAVESVAFAQASYSVEKGRTVEVLASVSPALASDRQVSYEIKEGSANPAGCITLAGNVVTGVEEGSAVIVAKSHEDPTKTAEATITVTPAVERNYGTLDNPLTVSQAKTVIDLDGGTAAETMYVKGKVTKNYAYSDQYKNIDIYVTDGVETIEFFRAKLPDGYATPIAEDALKGKVVTASGKGILYNNTKYELDSGCQILSITDEDLPLVTITGLIENSAVGIPETIEQGKSLDKNSISVGVTYSNGSEGVTHPDRIDLITTTTGKNIVGNLVVVAGETEFKYAFTIEVTEKTTPDPDYIELTATGLGLGSYGDGSNADYAWKQLRKGDNDTIQGNSSKSSELHNKNAYATEIDHIELEVGYAAGDNSQAKVYFGSAAEPSDEEKMVLLGKDTSYALNALGTLSIPAPEGSTFFKLVWSTYASYYSKIRIYLKEAVAPVDVESVTVDPSSLTLDVSEQPVQLAAEVLPEGATEKTVVWASGNENVATVSQDGVVTAVGAGSTDITATAGGQSGSCHVTVTKHVQSVSITKSVNVVAGETGNVAVTINPADAEDPSYTLESLDTSVATVTQNGVVTGVAEGETKIVVTTTDGGKTGECIVHVSALSIPVNSIELTGDASRDMIVGGELDLVAHGMPENATEDRGVTWSLVSGEGVVEISEAGHVNALLEGDAVVRATTVSHGFTADVAIHVDKVAVESVTLSKTELSLSPANSETLTVTTNPAEPTYPEVTWATSDEEVATVANGVVTAVAPGSATITATVDGVDATCLVTVAYAPGTQGNPYTVDELLTAYGTLGENEWSESRVYVTGEVIAISNALEYTLRGTNGNLAVYKPTSALGEEDVLPCVGDVAVFEGFVERYVYSTTDKIELTGYAKDTVEAHQVFPTIQSVVSRGTSEISLDANSSQNATVTFEGTATNASEYSFTVLIAEGYELTAVTVNGNALEGEDGVYSFIVKGNSVIKVTTHEAGQEVPDPWDYTFEAKKWDKAGEQTLDGHVWTMSGTGGAYFGYDGTKGQQFGSSSASYSALTLSCSDFSGTIASIDVYTSGASKIAGDVQVSVGGTSFGAAQALSATNTKYTFSLEEGATGEVQISWSQTSSKAFYVKQIVVTFK